MFLLEREGQGAWVREGKENKKGVRGTEWVFCGNKILIFLINE